MNKVRCDGCKNEVEVALYFYDRRIVVHEADAFNPEEHYEASVRGKATCPSCGSEIKKLFKKPIYRGRIIDLALGE